MAFSNGSLYGRLEGNTTGDTANSAFNSCNKSNPNFQPKEDLFQILGPGGICLLQVNSAGTVATSVAAGAFTTSTTVATVQMTSAQYAGLAASPTAAQICAAAFPLNYNGQELDIFQVASEIASPSVAGGGKVIYRLDYAGAAQTA